MTPSSAFPFPTTFYHENLTNFFESGQLTVDAGFSSLPTTRQQIVRANWGGCPVNDQNNGKFSRRDFALKAVLGSAAALVPASRLSDAATLPSANERLKDAFGHAKREEAQQLPAGAEKLSPQSRAECEARYQAILAQYAPRFSEAQKTDLRRLCYSAQPGLDKLRAYAVQNGDGSALYLKPLLERERKAAGTDPSGATKSALKPKD